jgi:hypothetical protein
MHDPPRPQLNGWRHGKRSVVNSMLTVTSIRLAVVAVALAVLAMSAADAQRIHPRCVTMRDKVGCTCALENGGGIGRRPGTNRRRWYSKRAGQQHVNEGFVQCMIRNGHG